jgi:hypothetical protein
VEIDQHALHERVLFEQLKERHAAGTPEVQRLLIPEPVEFTPRQAALAPEHPEPGGVCTRAARSFPPLESGSKQFVVVHASDQVRKATTSRPLDRQGPTP